MQKILYKNCYIKSLIIFTLFVASTTFAQDVIMPSGSARNITAKDFLPHKNSAKHFNETWSYQFIFDNGTRAFLNYSTLYVPASGQKIGCDLSFWNFKGKSYTVGRQYPPERLKADAANVTIDIKGEYKMEHLPGKNHRVLYTADKGGKFLLDVTFESAETGLVIGDGIWKIGSEKFAQYVLIPYGRVSGKIAYNQDTITVKGYAYMDKTWQTEQATDMAIRSVNFSTSANSPNFGGRISMTPNGDLFGYAIYNLGSAKKIAVPKAIKDSEKTYDGKSFPNGSLTIDWQDSNIPSLKFAANKTLEKASLLDKVDGWFAKKAFKIAAGGEVLFYRGKSESSIGKKIDWCVTGIK